MDQVADYLFKQGILGVLLVGSLILNGIFLRIISKDKDKHSEIILSITKDVITTNKDFMNRLDLQQKSIDLIASREK